MTKDFIKKNYYFNGSLNSSSVGSNTGASGGGVNGKFSAAFKSIDFRKLGDIRTAILNFHNDMYTVLYRINNIVAHIFN